MSALRTMLADMQVPRRRLIMAVAWGSASLGSAVGLAAVAAWMIARAAGMPSPADLAVAAVAVRFFGIGRGLFRYLERLASHHAALSGVVDLRVRIYERVAAARTDRAGLLARGDVMARLGRDVDTVGDAWIRGVIPLAVAAVVSTTAVVISWANVPAAGAVLLAGIVLAGGGAAALTWRSAAIAARAGVATEARVTVAALSALESAPEHRVWNTSGEVAAELADADRAAEQVHERAARPAALAAAIQTLAAGGALVGSVVLGVLAAQSGAVGPTGAAIVALLPLATFEAVGAVPAAVTQIFRSAQAAQRIEDLSTPHRRALDPAPTASSRGEPSTASALSPDMILEGKALGAAWPGMRPTVPVDLSVAPGTSLAIVGRSGIGKTTLLHTIAGALAPATGTVTLGGIATTDLDQGAVIGMTAEDAHLFGTTVLENLRVARGDIDEGQALDALEAVGLTRWLAGLPEGLDTRIGPGGGTVSGGERRRLLLARALLSPHPMHLIDEPAEHLDQAGRDALRAVLARMTAEGRTVVIVTHDLSFSDDADAVVTLDD